jgi:glutaredoxin 3
MYSTASCPFCVRAKALLRERGVAAIDEIRIDEKPGERETMMRLTKRRTVPQIFIGDAYVGGCDDLIALDRAGGLQPLLAGTR